MQYAPAELAHLRAHRHSTTDHRLVQPIHSFLHYEVFDDTEKCQALVFQGEHGKLVFQSLLVFLDVVSEPLPLLGADLDHQEVTSDRQRKLVYSNKVKSISQMDYWYILNFLEFQYCLDLSINLVIWSWLIFKLFTMFRKKLLLVRVEFFFAEAKRGKLLREPVSFC